jgi:hypothetical protein
MVPLLAALAGCVAIEKIESGERSVGRMVVTLEGAWNHVNVPALGPAQIWTMEGLTIDQLLLYSGIKDGEIVHGPNPAAAKRKDFAFRSTMQPDEIAAMFEGMLTRDGSIFKLVKLEPATFGGVRGFRFECILTRKLDHVVLSGMGYAAVSKGELFAILYVAPRLTFFSRHAPQVERIARSARVTE